MAILTNTFQNENNNDGDDKNLESLWNSSQPAPDDEPVPRGNYLTKIVEGKRGQANNGTKFYQTKHIIQDGDRTGQAVFQKYWLTNNAMPRTRRELAKHGITSFEQLDSPLPAELVCETRIVIEESDDGYRSNKIVRLKVVRVEEKRADPFAPELTGESDICESLEGTDSEKDKVSPETQNDTAKTEKQSDRPSPPLKRKRPRSAAPRCVKRRPDSEDSQ